MPRAVPSARKSLLLLALAAAIIGGAWWQCPPPEPVHDGQRLSELIAGQEFAEWIAGQGEKEIVRARNAADLRAFGPATVQWLVYTAEHGRHPFRTNGPLPFDNAPDWLRLRLPKRWGGCRPEPTFDERILALKALETLGLEAAPAIPSLARLLKCEREDEHGVIAFAAMALHAIGPTSWPVVQEALESGNPRARAALLYRIYIRLVAAGRPASGAEVEKVETILVKASTDANAWVRAGAVGGICRCCDARRDLNDFDPLMNMVIAHLSDSDKDVRLMTVNALSFCRDKAVPAIPQLINVLDDPDVWVRQAAARVLAELDKAERRSAGRLRVMSRDACVCATGLAPSFVVA
jgi:hypothetical protein